MADIFISHVEEDAQVALEIAQGLEAVGYTVWYYERDSVPGLSYLVQTGQAIEQSHAVVLIISVHSLGSNQVSSEVVRAHEAGKPFIPVLSQVTHSQFQIRQPLWRQAVGSASSITIPPEGIAPIIPRIISGLHALGIEAQGKGESREPEPGGVKLSALPRARQPEITVVPHKEAKPPWQHKWFWIAAVAFTVQGTVIVFLAWKLLQLSTAMTSPNLATYSPTAATSVSSPTSVPKHSPTAMKMATFTPVATVTAGPTRAFTRIPTLTVMPIAAPIYTATPVGMATPEAIKAYRLPLNDPVRVIYDGSALCVRFVSGQVRLELVEEESRFRISEQECLWPPGELAWDESRKQFWALDDQGISLKDQTGATTTLFEMPKDFLGSPTNIAWDGQYLWVTSSEGAIYKLGPMGNEIKTLDSYAMDFGIFPSSRASGLVWDGTHLWVLVDNHLTKVNQAMQGVCRIDLPSAPVWWAWKGLAWDGRFLWVIHNETNKLYRVDPQICH
ncbi:MAG: TIR domain-containing protein [Chloroflexi bacterium]|nr:TIR domain-containing protein [Chloroflexota bacterium]